MPRVDWRFENLNTIMDEVHDVLGWWTREALDADALDEDSIELLKLAVHEWMANLVQYAHFPKLGPRVTLSLRPCARHVRCVIEDNSSGFDFAGQFRRQEQHISASPEPPERGRGLLLLAACTQELEYGPIEDGAGDPPILPDGFRLGFLVPRRDGLAELDGDRSLEFCFEPPPPVSTYQSFSESTPDHA